MRKFFDNDSVGFQKAFLDMKKIVYIASLIFLASCAKKNPAQNPGEQYMSQNEMEDSKNRTKDLNTLERTQIQDWIKSQEVKYYPMGMNYWVNIEGLEKQPRKNNGEKVSYKYDIYDFDRVKLYDSSIGNTNVEFGHFGEMDAVEDVIRYLKKGEEAEILVPSVLAYGTYGDGKKISNDMPLIIKVKVL
ncbi:FKBP-type peptidyl-prolyl cis-trans isomerase [Epilithonimonas ginsengisoli]|uniref:Peptidyl-prolyl cis-trans isomerase n=1 Tax=Epilithonimonas ginsengisoli TaxID=1245592 RepID=A0ABU4JDW9_9FLAO|nr:MULTISPECIES: FKBP-type peptidyl-prolyl cis-trans isomerase [Chryseobacterium group]MDW8547803.1 FKBP-type peptidyl-prolyl cis-trans isomerase [Epilithonimonas ginsengisoli]